METYYLYAFESTHGAIYSHKLLREHMDAVMMPVLREISASCGMAVKVPAEDAKRSAELMLQQDEVEFSLYRVTGHEVEKLDPKTL
ncbi:MAG: DUF3343 domain-containing protein [Ruminococcaceae bacterium]|jgi:hypothetical protein|nr:DUF3343 domain-containing protein [Oscillospiraceae bacterium]